MKWLLIILLLLLMPVCTASRGDVNQDRRITVSDIILLVKDLFEEEPLPCIAAADADSDGTVTLHDALFLLNYLYAEGPAPEDDLGDGIC